LKGGPFITVALPCASDCPARQAPTPRTGPLRYAGILAPHVVQELGRWLDARHQQVVSRTGAGNIEQLPFGLVHLAQISVVADHLDPLLQRDRSLPLSVDIGKWSILA
jgi:hypothetical protein